MIKIDHLKKKLIEPVVLKYRQQLPALNIYDDKFYVELSTNLMIGTVVAESYGGYYLYDNDYNKNGIYGMTIDMLRKCVNEDTFPRIDTSSIETAFDNLIYDLNFATEMAYIFYIKSGAIEWLARESEDDPEQINKLTNAWLNYYHNGEANPARFYALYCKMVLNKYKPGFTSNRCNRCGLEDKRFAYHKSSNIDYDTTQPPCNHGRNFDDAKYFNTK